MTVSLVGSQSYGVVDISAFPSHPLLSTAISVPEKIVTKAAHFVNVVSLPTTSPPGPYLKEITLFSIAGSIRNVFVERISNVLLNLLVPSIIVPVIVSVHVPPAVMTPS